MRYKKKNRAVEILEAVARMYEPKEIGENEKRHNDKEDKRRRTH